MRLWSTNRHTHTRTSHQVTLHFCFVQSTASVSMTTMYDFHPSPVTMGACLFLIWFQLQCRNTAHWAISTSFRDHCSPDSRLWSSLTLRLGWRCLFLKFSYHHFNFLVMNMAQSSNQISWSPSHKCLNECGVLSLHPLCFTPSTNNMTVEMYFLTKKCLQKSSLKDNYTGPTLSTSRAKVSSSWGTCMTRIGLTAMMLWEAKI